LVAINSGDYSGSCSSRHQHIIYAIDSENTEKQQRAIELLEQLEAAGNGRLGVQSLAEFFSASTRKLQPPLTWSEATIRVENLIQAFPVLDLTSLIVLEAARGVRDGKLSYFDSQIWATARLIKFQ
jgi:predicted nucleic acid-binding protein